MRKITFGILAGTLLLASGSYAQHQQAPSPYADFASRQIKALSEQQIADLKAGRGMGLALAAELNGYPGPSHALELAEKLALSDAQRLLIQTLFDAMKSETIPLGEDAVALESAMDKDFAEKTITAQSLASATTAIGAANARLRAAHLKYHLAMAEVLTPAQVLQYNQIRGYDAGASAHRHRQSP